MQDGMILCSTGALIGKPNQRNHKLLESFSKELACDGFEFMMYSSWYEKVEEIISDLLRFSLNIPVVHCEKHIGEAISIGGKENFAEAERLFRINCEIAKALSSEKLVIHLWDGIPSDKHFNNNLSFCPVLYGIAEEYGLQLLIENVICNTENPMKHWCELAKAYPFVKFIYDTKMAAFHAQEHLLYEKEYEWLMKDGYIKHFHINDYAGGYMDFSSLKVVPMGEGHVDFDRFFKFLKTTDYHGHLTVEATAFRSDGTVDSAMLNRCFAKLREYLS